ncbi:SUMF1/EgtB/PvdO family nonheme iron enzyme [Rubritalea marina]|uniref:SUMF1/EgtB/PvdO family nonheme iron enzyme n=1 Tax=Rubritalea marina TaxID=361055 RepID=UPI000367ED7E|nr:SUMF1/EgtB/PvdO family nonheme iron enzyme [Rubritalea marina]
METTFQRVLKVGDQVGDYLFEGLLIDGEDMNTWKAKQISVSRGVIIDSLNLPGATDQDVINTFLDDVRAKAKVDHPLIGSVFEAFHESPHCFYARERLQGTNLQVSMDTKKQWLPKQMIRIIAQLAEANYFFERRQVATLPILPEHIFIGDDLLTRVINMAVGGEYSAEVGLEDRISIATALKPMLKTGEQGATRVRSLLDHMCDLEREVPVTWRQVLELSRQVEADLSYASTEQVPQSDTVKLERRRKQQEVIAMISVVFIVFCVLVGLSQMIEPEKRSVARDLSQMLQIDAGEVEGLDGDTVDVETFWIDSHEVTIAEYAKFLEVMEMFDERQRSVYQHENQPSSKVSHIPDDWEAMHSAAKLNGEWNGLVMDLNCPVVGIDWWDAYAYCNHIRKRLPSVDEWRLIVGVKKEGETMQKASPWGQVDASQVDVTPPGLHGMAGNVSEWAAAPAKDPASPVKPEMWMLLGGAYDKVASDASTIEWIDLSGTELEDGRNLRRSNVGFRAVSDRAPRL